MNKTNYEAAPTPSEVWELFKDPRVRTVIWYPEGFVANNYKYPAPGKRTIWNRDQYGEITKHVQTYDRKRTHGRGPTFVALSEKGGRLKSL